MRVLHARLIGNLCRARYRGLSVTWIDDQKRRSAASVIALGARPLHRLVLYEGPIADLT